MQDDGITKAPGTMSVLAKAFLDPGAHRTSLPLLADLLLKGGRAAEALMLVDRYHRTGPETASSRLTEAGARARLSGPGSALAPLRRAVRLDPTDPAPARALMQVLARQGQRREAADILAAVLPWIDDPQEAVALLAAGRPGWQVHGRCELRAGAIVGWLAWTGGGARRDLVLDVAGRELRVGVPARDRGSQSGMTVRTGSFSVPWPGVVDRLAVRDAQTGERLVGSPLVNEAFFPAVDLAPVDLAAGDGRVTVVVPVHGDADATMRCLDSLLRASCRTPHRILVVDDASPLPAIVRHLDRLAAAGHVALLRNPANLGFVRAVNRALALVPEGDVVLLNADTVVPPGWLDRLAAVAEEPGVGTVTPLSNNGELVSVPRPFRATPLGSDAQVAAIDAFVAQAAAQEGVPAALDLPNGVGFCLYVTAAARAAAGQLDAGLYRRGYLEEVDYCLRIRAAGLRNLCATGVFVGHEGSVSFGEEKRALVRHNARALAHRWPQIHQETDSFVAADPLSPLRARPEWLGLLGGEARRGLVVARRADADRLRRLAAPEGPAIVIAPGPDGRLEAQSAAGMPWVGIEGGSDEPATLARHLSTAGVTRLILADWARLDPAQVDRLAAAGLPHDLLVCDASPLVAPRRPGAEGATAALLVSRSERILCPTATALRAMVTAWPALQARMVLQDAPSPVTPVTSVPPEATHLGVLVSDDGEETHVALAALARSLSAIGSRLRLVVIGGTADDVALLRGPGVFVTGRAGDAQSVADAIDTHACSRLLIAFREASFGHHALQAAAASGLPCAGWPVGDAAAILGGGPGMLPLEPGLSVETLAARLDAWVNEGAGAMARVA